MTSQAFELLSDATVVDFSLAVPGSFCSALLAQFGARVTQVVDIGGRDANVSDFSDAYLSDSSIYHPYLVRGKEVVTVDLSTPQGGVAVRGLIDSADVVIEDWQAGRLESVIYGDTVAAPWAGLPVLASVTPYGRRGPLSGVIASELTIFLGGGPGHGTPGLVSSPETMPPLRMGSHQALFVGGLGAAINVISGLLAARRQGIVSTVKVDFSCQEGMANAYRQSLGTYAFYGGGLNRDLAKGRGAGGTVDHRNIRCKDGWFNLAWAGEPQWRALQELLGYPAWMDDGRLKTAARRYQNWELVLPNLESWASEHEKAYLFNICQGYRIPCAPVNEGPDLLELDVFRSRDYWDTTGSQVMPGPATRWRSPQPAEEAPDLS